MKKDREVNGYLLVYEPDHPKAMKSENWDGYVYEHILVAEEIIDRPLKEGEEVHHLDQNRSNNSPDNLLVLSGPMHAKLHAWMNKHTIIPNEQQQERIRLGCVRCQVCKKPISPELNYCSPDCYAISSRKVERPNKEELQKLVWEKPTSQLAQDYGVSDKAIEKWCKAESIDKPPRGHWQKIKFNKE